MEIEEVVTDEVEVDVKLSGRMLGCSRLAKRHLRPTRSDYSTVKAWSCKSPPKILSHLALPCTYAIRSRNRGQHPTQRFSCSEIYFSTNLFITVAWAALLRL